MGRGFDEDLDGNLLAELDKEVRPTWADVAEMMQQLEERDPEVAQWLADFASGDPVRRLDAMSRTTSITSRLTDEAARVIELLERAARAADETAGSEPPTEK